jgi:hypothetical protein
VDDKALLGNDSVKQQWKRSDRCYAVAQYTRVNNGGEDVFCGFTLILSTICWYKLLFLLSNLVRVYDLAYKQYKQMGQV